MLSRVVSLALLGLVSGCAAANCDPSQAGFFSGVGCEASGAYTQRNQAQQTQLAGSRSAALAERAQALDAQDTAYASQSVLDAKRRRLQAIDQQNGQLQRRLATARNDDRINQAQFARAQAQLVSLQRERSGLSSASSDASFAQYEKDLLAVTTGMSDLSSN